MAFSVARTNTSSFSITTTSIRRWAELVCGRSGQIIKPEHGPLFDGYRKLITVSRAEPKRMASFFQSHRQVLVPMLSTPIGPISPNPACLLYNLRIWRASSPIARSATRFRGTITVRWYPAMPCEESTGIRRAGDEWPISASLPCDHRPFKSGNGKRAELRRACDRPCSTVRLGPLRFDEHTAITYCGY